MARGRFISSKIAQDKKVHSLSDDTSRLAFTWLITFADCEGRTPGDPAVVRSLLFPRRIDISIDDMERYLAEWADAGLIYWYKYQDDLFVMFPAFEKNQSGLRKNREAPSSLPDPTHGVSLRTNSGVSPEQLPVNVIKDNVKLSQCKGDGGEAITFFTNNFHLPTPHEYSILEDMSKNYPEDWVMDALKGAVEHSARNIKYVAGILRNRKEGKGKGEQSKDDALKNRRMAVYGHE